MTGADYERDLVRALDACGFVAMRAPASGSATERALPDVLALQHRPVPGREQLARVLAVELKVTKATTAYAGGDEIDALEDFARDAGAVPIVAAKFKRPGSRSPFYLVPPADCRHTDGGNYGVPEADVDERAVGVLYPATAAKPADMEGSP